MVRAPRTTSGAMKVYLCKQCGRAVSVHFESCPHCGESVPLHLHGSARYVLLSAILVVVAIVAMLLARWI